MIVKNQAIVIEKCENGFMVMPQITSGECFQTRHFMVFNHIGYGSPHGDDAQESLVSWLCKHFAEESR